ncbi:AraC family transcriptional regulator [Dyadobacter chenwenxiniae]|uniref:AraC family transcriptional regulator n=1 Tax=Dyadobacter chenwenxiniae TaxID=2906456 RepID=A0A9X1TPR4_9BACT|nr:AraC family transcriptional regulator [Dyadobacter chenwenxiniae]MCF0065773.1 AraC family transcriptional regulator [Dyadobacter chenwenxiniae]UON84144.1 AraC family transcriptional regulator [Dyadobacter chenwenxiniae]
MSKVIKVPTALVSGPGQQSALMLDGCSVIEQCIHSMEAKGTMYLEEHLLLIVLEGTVTLTYGKQQYTLGKNDMILLKKAISVQYDKVGNPDNDNIYDSLMFSLKDDLLKTFLASSEVKVPKIEGEVKTAVYPMNECLVAFAYSLKPYFHDDSIVHPGQLRLKIMELLYDVAECNRNMFLQILQLHQPVRAEIRQVVEQHYASPVSLLELAYLSGRSLSSFKRDFQMVYNTSPASWIREKRLEKAKDMLETTLMSVSDICYTLGFENVSHFSRIFKQYHGQAPSVFRS